MIVVDEPNVPIKFEVGSFQSVDIIDHVTDPSLHILLRDKEGAWWLTTLGTFREEFGSAADVFIGPLIGVE